MDESANKGLESMGSDAEIRESSIRRISVKGYDTSLRKEDIEEALREHFASCGNIIHVYVPRSDETGIICRYAFIYVSEEDEEKALRLDGSDMGGQILEIKSYPFHVNHLDNDLAPMKEINSQRTIEVTGFDTSLSDDVIMTELENYFSARRSLFIGSSTANLYVFGQEGVEKALERSGRSVGGLNFIVTRVLPISKRSKCGFTNPRIFARLTKEQIEDPNLYFIYEGNQNMSETIDGNQKIKKTKKKKKKKKSKTKTKIRDGNQTGVEISL